ncbi:MAG: thioredoxin reductase [Firmicutes bacterium HGW-Firmicutes-20]|jgi:alkyl hydroperoxide reductase subunit F|nr:MAG: thioredoxin reductase [Firmicutes bacterium HGW-Firmicutes-20]PKM65047.1 MAG: thioredoxin reductase [Firmicutes bacterium HGW-Firmicutes-19]
MSFNFNFNLNETKKAIKLTNEDVIDLLVIGGGPAGLNAALYAKRKGLTTGIIAKRIGGQLLNTSSVDNYLGISQVSGEELSEKYLSHLKELDVGILEEVEVENIHKSDRLFEVLLKDGTVFTSKTLLIATGSSPRKLQVRGEEEYSNRGVAYCAICDAPLFKGKNVIIAGGGNSAVEAAIDVAKFASHVTLVHRSELRADQILIDHMNHQANITIHLQTQILEIIGDDKMTGVKVLDKQTLLERVIDADGIFIEIGNLPSNHLIKNLVSLNERGEVIVDEKNMTSLPGLFAAGDVTQMPYKQIVIAVADGAKAALAANEYMNQNF